jgi:predicted extracellular nuclease
MIKVALLTVSLILVPMSVMNNKFSYLFCCIFVLISVSPLCGQQKGFTTEPQKRGDIRIMFYNTENFYDTIDDPHHNDEEYLPTSEKQWNYKRYREKTMHVFKTIVAVGGIQPPEIIGFAEIENRKILEDLIQHTPLEKFNYKIIHKESDDKRGIDVGVIYRPDKIKCLKYDFVKVVFPWDNKKTTRDIVYFVAATKKDTFHVFVNHWPSRMGGQKKSNPNRCFVASLLRHKVDSIFSTNNAAKIIITGDFNDQPRNESLATILDAEKPVEIADKHALYNLSWALKDSCHCGSLRYGAQWNMLDQFIVSGSLLRDNTRLTTCVYCVHIGYLDFLLIEDTKYGGYKPFRTYQGPIYKGGYSDHLPVYLDLYF